VHNFHKLLTYCVHTHTNKKLFFSFEFTFSLVFLQRKKLFGKMHSIELIEYTFAAILILANVIWSFYLSLKSSVHTGDS